MPKGVEHEIVAQNMKAMGAVMTSVMPKGVEHSRSMISSLTSS